jgi:ADP-ribosylglycohydrolase
LTISREDRITGCLLGGALGDSIGAHFENTEQHQEFSIPVDLRVTDDTQLSIATCESIIESGKVGPEYVANHLLRWYRERRIIGIGSSTLKSLTELDADGHWAFVGATGERSAGNGAAMRVAPLAFFLDPDIDTERQMIRDICRITHRNDEAYIGALAILRTLRHVISGGKLNDEVLTILVANLPDSNVRDRLTDVRDSTLNIAQYVDRFAASGYVVDSVPLAILAALQSSDITDTIHQLVRSGGDTDTIASMFGQMFGATYGIKRLPMDTVNQIDSVALVRETAADLSHVSITM